MPNPTTGSRTEHGMTSPGRANSDHDSTPDFSEIPARLGRDLRGLETEPGRWSERGSAFDARATAADHFAGVRRRRMLFRGASLAAAAGLALAVIFIPMRSRHGPAVPPGQSSSGSPLSTSPGSVATSVRGDLNGDGLIDMIDALILARAVDTTSARSEWDFNADGAVNQTDVDRLAQGAVKLTGGGL